MTNRDRQAFTINFVNATLSNFCVVYLDCVCERVSDSAYSGD